MNEAAAGVELSAEPSSVAVGVVVIGRNEGERLRRSLDSVCAIARLIVYVDSGSTDKSVELAQSKDVEVVRLDMSSPFTAARARNAGFQRLQQIAPDVPYVQFVDGDCEIIHGWLDAAMSFLDQRADVACVCGRLRERFPERSIYNRLCDVEWDRPAGETDASGGIAMMRSTVFATQRGFRDDLLAGEEPELCLRMRSQGWKIWRLAQPMAWHDAAMLHFSQWWKRSRRIGFGYAQGAFIHGASREQRSVRHVLRAWIWAGVLPLVVAISLVALGAPALLLILAYPLQMLRIARKINGPWNTRLARAFFLLLSKFPELLGQFQFWIGRRPGGASPSFDYKS
jgi:glycosyltransferase involved in cell wall biosynthesis